MPVMLFGRLIILLFFGTSESFRESEFGTRSWSQPDVCKPGPKGRVPWILHVRDSDYGWKENTHRANIALAVNEYRGDEDEMRKMGLQLEVEITRAIFRNKTSRIHDSDLALYIHALLATKKNPRNFHGTDLVADLLHRVKYASGQINPFFVLALCNSHAVEYDHLERIDPTADLQSRPCHSGTESHDVQLKALALKAFACQGNLRNRLSKFYSVMRRIVECLEEKYNKADGSFGSIFTTSLAVQALTASEDQLVNALGWWDERKSLEYLERESEIDVNLIKAYYIEMALNARKSKFIKDLYNGVPLPGTAAPPQDDKHYVQYTVKKRRHPEMYFGVTLNVAKETNFYDIMTMASGVSAEFNFTTYQNNNGDPMVYSVAGIPNDAEENMFWRLCRQYNVNHETHSSLVQAIAESPAKYVPHDGDHLTYMYSDEDCFP